MAAVQAGHVWPAIWFQSFLEYSMTAPLDTDARDASDRLRTLDTYDILDSPREAGFDGLVALAAQLCEAPISVVNLIASDRQWFKAEVGLGLRETPLDVSICKHVLLQPGLTVIDDLRNDPRMNCNPLVSVDGGLRFYAGCLLETPDGVGLGTLCILDTKPRELREDQRFALKILASQVMTQMELRKSLREKEQLLVQQEMLLQEVNHRTKNNLQLIVNLIQLQQRQLTDDVAREALLDTSRRIMSIAAVHERLYKADQAGSVDAASYLQEIMRGIQATAPAAVAFDVSLASVHLALDRAIPLALIVNELAINSLKYAYPGADSGLISVRLACSDRHVTLIVADAGLGLPQGFEDKKSRSLGMRIIMSLARQIGAEVIFTNLRPGVECKVSFDL
ncbi:sensor histidine kinase [Pseudomonas sp. Leaf127]|uniref:sensor histidine kinase n=1 Tax=Pseudomonas sp. Leaf127 TaxID=1736267 RepID=UPI0009EC6853|nr:histidine kinase dimerization/phosphoacceptor domain -containing protein [Pseudomonas sp. Leaf127]